MRGGRLFASCLLGALAACSTPTQPTPPDDPGPATAPVIRSITVPSSRVEAGQDVVITAVVEDAETPLTDLVYTWSASAGTITGTGTTATWRMPAGITAGVDVVITLTVVDNFERLAGNVLVRGQFTVVETSSVFRVHDSEAETKELARKFLIDLFGNSSVPPADCMVDFADVCAHLSNGRIDELSQIVANRELVLIREATLLIQRLAWNSADTGSVHSAVLYDDIYLDGSPKLPTCGDFEVTVVYVNGRWWICQSFYNKDDKTACPSALDNRAAALTLGSQLGKAGGGIPLIQGSIR
jgi:hypothetical protein